MNPQNIFCLLFFMLFNSSHSFHIAIKKCRTQANSKGFCREEVDCVGAQEPLLPENCPNNYICCPIRDISMKKCVEYSEAAMQLEDMTIESCGMDSHKLIVGGKQAAEMEFPYMVVFGYRNKSNDEISWECGGSLISERYVLTAAHCISLGREREIVLKLGALNIYSNDENYVQQRGIEDLIRHPKYYFSSQLRINNDIALLRMEKDVEFTKFVRPVCLDYKGEIDQKYKDKVTAIGYGYVEIDLAKRSDVLMKVELEIIAKKRCDYHYKRNLADSVLCAGSVKGGKDTCRGDSGGPILVKPNEPHCMDRMVGITSFGKQCAYRHSFNVYARVFWYIPWIESIVWPGES